jgi:hypothetical protein
MGKWLRWGQLALISVVHRFAGSCLCWKGGVKDDGHYTYSFWALECQVHVMHAYIRPVGISVLLIHVMCRYVDLHPCQCGGGGEVMGKQSGLPSHLMYGKGYNTCMGMSQGYRWVGVQVDNFKPFKNPYLHGRLEGTKVDLM